MGALELKPGDMVAYSRHPEAEAVEIGVVKRVVDNGAFVVYHTGDTCAKTPFEYLKIVQNDYAAKALVERMEQLGKKTWGLSEDCEDWSAQ